MRIVARGLLAVAVWAPNATAQTSHDYIGADARFMRDMILHHAQAVAMAGLVPARTSRRDLVALALRIAVGQATEIRMMRRWLDDRGEPGPEATHPEHATMPGMLDQSEVTELVGLRGTPFERRFLEAMIRHHEGALAMTRRLFSDPGAGREPALWEFASDIERTQQAEAELMRRMLPGSEDQPGRRPVPPRLTTAADPDNRGPPTSVGTRSITGGPEFAFQPGDPQF